MTRAKKYEITELLLLREMKIAPLFIDSEEMRSQKYCMEIQGEIFGDRMIRIPLVMDVSELRVITRICKELLDEHDYGFDA